MTADENRAVRVLLVEDEAQIRKFLRITLEAHGYEVYEARLGEQGVAEAARVGPDLVVLDLGLPDMDGRTVIQRIREWSRVPILVLSVRAEEEEKVRALDAGANDYVNKPAGISELMARIRAQLRTRPATDGVPPVFRHGPLTVDLARRQVRVHGEPVHLTRKEYDLLRVLVTHAGRVMTHPQLLREVWGPGFEGEAHYLRVLVSGLRQKLGDDPSAPRYIVTEQGVGYRLLEAS